ncbi:hypothetical protein ACFSQ7_50675 [Paenibacillus rhizoplanae]
MLKESLVKPVTAEEEGGTAELLTTEDSPAAPESGDDHKLMVKGTPLVIEGTGEYTVTKTSFGKKRLVLPIRGPSTPTMKPRNQGQSIWRSP